MAEVNPMTTKRNRRHPRFTPDRFVVVFDSLSREKLGHVVNFSAAGMQLIGKVPIDTNTGRVFALELTLPEPIEGKYTLAISALSIWLKREPEPGYFVTGLQIVVMDRVRESIWNTLVSGYGKSAHKGGSAEPSAPDDGSRAPSHA
jgi:hypothetical protein